MCYFFKPNPEIMSDDKSKKVTLDRMQIDSNDRSEVQYVAEKFGVSAEEVVAAIKSVGNDREKVYQRLKQAKS